MIEGLEANTPRLLESAPSYGVQLNHLLSVRTNLTHPDCVIHPTTQVKIFGSFVRWSQDVPPPSSAYPGRTILTIAGDDGFLLEEVCCRGVPVACADATTVELSALGQAGQAVQPGLSRAFWLRCQSF